MIVLAFLYVKHDSTNNEIKKCKQSKY